MEFGWINIFGSLIVIIMLMPNVVFSLKHKNAENKCKNIVMNGTEQIGRYLCIVLMWFPLFVKEFGFKSVAEMLIYVLGNGVLLVTYLIIWFFYFKNPTAKKALSLAVIPTIIFLLSGILLRHWLLVAAAVLFGIGHIYVTVQNNK